MHQEGKMSKDILKQLEDEDAKVLAEIGAFKVAGTLGISGDPKREAGEKKPGIGHISPVALFLEGEVMRQGADTYGAYNWADHQMKASVYFEAMQRHLYLWFTGEDADQKSGVTHLAHIRACCAILIDQQFAHRLIDDRPKDLADLGLIMKMLETKIAGKGLPYKPKGEPTMEEKAAIIRKFSKKEYPRF